MTLSLQVLPASGGPIPLGRVAGACRRADA